MKLLVIGFILVRWVVWQTISWPGAVTYQNLCTLTTRLQSLHMCFTLGMFLPFDRVRLAVFPFFMLS